MYPVAKLARELWNGHVIAIGSGVRPSSLVPRPWRYNPDPVIAAVATISTCDLAACAAPCCPFKPLPAAPAFFQPTHGRCLVTHGTVNTHVTATSPV